LVTEAEEWELNSFDDDGRCLAECKYGTGAAEAAEGCSRASENENQSVKVDSAHPYAEMLTAI
jgi:hypothetical protein